MIALAINIACAVGLRAAENVIKTFFDWLKINASIPDWTSIRMWMCRYGVGLLEEPIEHADDWILMADHSNQIGTEKVLVILGIHASHMPPKGQALRYEDMRVMAVVPGTNWQREDVAKQYKLVAQRIGTPLAIVTDGAVELRESAVGLENEGKIVMMFRDFKRLRMNTKLGWLRGFRDDIARWNRCQDIISRSLTVINEEGLSFYGGCAASDAFMNQLINFVEESEQQLQAGIRVPLSTEILESSFGQYKLLERQHSKGVFTTLIAAFPGLLKPCTAELVKQTFSRMTVSKLKEWTFKQFGRTLAAKKPTKRLPNQSNRNKTISSETKFHQASLRLWHADCRNTGYTPAKTPLTDRKSINRKSATTAKMAQFLIAIYNSASSSVTSCSRYEVCAVQQSALLGVAIFRFAQHWGALR